MSIQNVFLHCFYLFYMLDYRGICNSKNHIIALTVINTVLDKISKSLNAECILTEGYVIFLYKQHFSGNM